MKIMLMFFKQTKLKKKKTKSKKTVFQFKRNPKQTHLKS